VIATFTTTPVIEKLVVAASANPSREVSKFLVLGFRFPTQIHPALLNNIFGLIVFRSKAHQKANQTRSLS
jgi:hypothetical protein